MPFTAPLTDFRADESGAVTVDWVVLTAALVGLAMAALGIVSTGVEDLGGDITADLTALEPTDNPFVGNDTEIATYD